MWNHPKTRKAPPIHVRLWVPPLDQPLHNSLRYRSTPLLTVLLWSLAVLSAGARSPVRDFAERYTLGEMDAAQSILLKAEAEKPGDPRLQLEEAALHEEMGDLEGAARYYNLAASSNGQEDLQIDAASSLARSGHWNEAARILISFLETPPGHPDALWELALVHRSLAMLGGWEGRSARAEWRLARGCLEALVAQRPEMSAAQMLLGECDETLGDGDAAVAAYESALSLEPSYRKLNARVARLLKRKGRSAEALDWYEKATAVEPQNALLQREKARLLKRWPRLVKERREERMRRWEAVTPPTQTDLPSSSIMVRVGLTTHLFRIVLRGGGDLQVLTPAGNVIRVLEGNCDYAVVWPGEGPGAILDDRKNKLVTFNQRLWIQPVHPADTIALHALTTGTGYFFATESDRSYRGLIEIHPGPGKGFGVINRIPLEEYIAGVLPSEMPSHWPLEALKAQAVAARTDTLSMMGRHNAEGFDVCDEVHCQAYRGIQSEREVTNRAVSETSGVVLMNGNQPFPAVYSAQCGGRTQSFKEAWGREAPVVGVADYDAEGSPGTFPLPPWELKKWVKEASGAYCDMPTLKGYRNFRWMTILSGSDLQAKERLQGIGRILSVRVTKRSQAGWAQEVLFTGESGEKRIQNDAIRGVLGGLRSNLVWFEDWKDADGFLDELIIYGGGWGHGVGMCLVGACGLAKRGWDFRRILKHYYPEAAFKKIPPN